MADNRPLHYAIAASLGVHVVLLFAFPDWIERARRVVQSAPPLIARLMEQQPDPAPVPAPPAEKKAPRETPKVEKKKPVEARSVTSPLVTPTPAPVVAAPQPVPAPPPMSPPEQAPMASAKPSALPAAPLAQQQAPEALSRDQYRLQLIDEARRHKRYPPLARENNWQGDVLVGVAIGANGRASITLKGSSGYDVLDRQALEMFRQATRTVAIPPALRGKEFALDVRAVYGLED